MTPSAGKTQAQIATDVAALITAAGATTSQFKAVASDVNIRITSPSLNAGISVANKAGMTLVKVGTLAASPPWIQDRSPSLRTT